MQSATLIPIMQHDGSLCVSCYALVPIAHILYAVFFDHCLPLYSPDACGIRASPDAVLLHAH